MKEKVTATRTMIVLAYWFVATTIVFLSLVNLEAIGTVKMTVVLKCVLLRHPVSQLRYVLTLDFSLNK